MVATVTDRRRDAFVIVGWREEDGTVTVCASEHPDVAETTVVDVPMLETAGRLDGTVYEGRPFRFRVVDRKLKFRVEGYSEAGESQVDGEYVPTLLRLLERWLPHDTDSVVEVYEPAAEVEPGVEPGHEGPWCDARGLTVSGGTPRCWLPPGHEGGHEGPWTVDGPDGVQRWRGDVTSWEANPLPGPPRDGAWYAKARRHPCLAGQHYADVVVGHDGQRCAWCGEPWPCAAEQARVR